MFDLRLPTVTLLAACCLATISFNVYGQEKPTLTKEEKQLMADSIGADNRDDQTWGAINPGKGFTLATTKMGSLNISGYMLARYMNQMPPSQIYYDHLGNEKTTDGRNDILWHRVQAFIQGWVYDPRLNYVITLWTVNATNQVAIAGSMSFSINKYFKVTAGINGLPGTRSLGGSHPYWLGTDRVMADEYFRPGFTSGVWVSGEPLKNFRYMVMLGENLSELGIAAGQFNRKLGYGATVWWMPTSGEFGPRGAYGDWEDHQQLATRFGGSFAHHRENRYSNLSQNSPDNTAIRLSDANLLFATGSLANGVTVIEANYNIFSFDAGFKYKGLFFQTEYYLRNLNKFEADGPLPLSSIFDHGFMVQVAGFPIKKKLELYAATSQIFGSFNNANEYLVGTNFYPFKTRNVRVNGQVIFVNRSPVSSVFGYYTGGQTGTTMSIATSILF